MQHTSLVSANCLWGGHSQPHSSMANTISFFNDTTLSSDILAKLDDNLDNLAAAATTESTMLNQLVNNNATLMANITSLTASLALLTLANALLATTKLPSPSAATTQTGHPLQLDPLGYCWTHGYQVKQEHSSTSCTKPGDGHKHAAIQCMTARPINPLPHDRLGRCLAPGHLN